jgi:hypothetical protein
MAVKTKAQILAEIASLLADNTTGDISASDIRTCLNDITDSYGESLEISGTLTAAQINLLDTTPIKLIDSQGANTLIVIESCYAIRKAGTAYTTAGNIVLAYSGGDDQGIIVNNSSLTQTSEIVIIQPAPMQSTFLTSGNSNANIQFECDAAISGGTGDIYYTIKYKIVDFN